MSYAIETKKRKFHRVLESLSRPLSGDTTTKPPNNVAASTARERPAQDLSIKKARLGNDSSDPFNARKSSILKISRPSSSRTSSTSSTSRTSRPSFVPWDRERFLERLETFRRVDRWSSKPAEINEVQWSKRGWICTDTSRVTCVGGCGGSVVIKLPDEIDELDGYDDEKVQERKEVRSRLVEEYSRLLIEGHGENCAWRNKGCDATIHRLPLTNPEIAIANLLKRYANLVMMGTQLPAYNTIQTPEGFHLEEIAKILPAEYFNDEQGNGPREAHSQEEHSKEGDPQEGNESKPHPASNENTQEKSQTQPEDHDHQQSIKERPDIESEQQQQQQQQQQKSARSPGNHDTNKEKSPQPINDLNKSALALAFFGWDTVTSDGAAAASGLVGCRACFRRLGLWLYKPKENGDLTVYGNLDVTNEHMEYCPWINGEAQSGSGSEPATEKKKKPEELLRNGWELLAQALMVKHRRQIRSTATLGRVESTKMNPNANAIEEPNPNATPEPNPGPEPVIVDEETKKVADREWWGKIRRMKQMLNVKARS